LVSPSFMWITRVFSSRREKEVFDGDSRECQGNLGRVHEDNSCKGE
jgi:hypothetical protein